MTRWYCLAASDSSNAQPFVADYGASLTIVALLGIVLMASMFAWSYYRFTAGPVLLDCGPHPMRSTFLSLGFFFLFLSLAGAFATSTSGATGVAPHLFGVTFATWWLILATGRLQMRERGIWQYWSLLPWRKIASYRWIDNSKLLLNSDYQSSSKDPISIPHQQRRIVDSLLVAHLDMRPPSCQ